MSVYSSPSKVCISASNVSLVVSSILVLELKTLANVVGGDSVALDRWGKFPKDRERDDPLLKGDPSVGGSGTGELVEAPLRGEPPGVTMEETP